MRTRPSIRSALGISALLLFAATAGAQQSGDSSARLRLQLNQANAELVRLQQENGTLQSNLDTAQAELERVQGRLERTESRLSRANSTADQYRQATERNSNALEAQRERMTEIVERFRETASVLRTIEQENGALQAELATVQSDYQACARNNAELYETAETVLSAFEDTGVFRRVVAKEPFTQLTRVRLENLVDEYRFALEDNRLNTDTTKEPKP